MKAWETVKEVTRFNAVKRLFAFVEVKKSEVVGLVTFVILATFLEGLGLTLILPILQYAEGGTSALEDGGGFYWQFLADALAFFNLQPTLVVLLLLAFASVILRNVSFYFRTWYGAVVSSRIMLRLRMKVVDVVFSADPEFYSRNPVGQMVGVVMGQTGAAGGAVLTIINLLGTVLLMLLYIVILLLLSVPLTLVALFFALLVTLVNRRVLS
ncbi:MAG: ABC transporter transmembrane domain-containing protein, partial [Coriobacteriia bacterium]|nr:ABC transporter transmembrane domain-containing protein [Coriobacteriia bacterium]